MPAVFCRRTSWELGCLLSAKKHLTDFSFVKRSYFDFVNKSYLTCLLMFALSKHFLRLTTAVRDWKIVKIHFSWILSWQTVWGYSRYLRCLFRRTSWEQGRDLMCHQTCPRIETTTPATFRPLFSLGTLKCTDWLSLCLLCAQTVWLLFVFRSFTSFFVKYLFFLCFAFWYPRWCTFLHQSL